MKLNKISMVLAAMAIVGCSSEDLNELGAKQAAEDSRLIQVDQNFVLAGVGEEGVATRTHWANGAGGSMVNVFLPIWASAPSGSNFISVDADLEAQAIGLCWLGQGTVGTDVYTNYEFYHYGWLNNGQTQATFECNELKNGSLYNEITVAAGDAAGDEADPTNFTLPAKSAATGLDYNSGIYKTYNKAIFGGQYIVYYPFNKEFKDAGTIPATAETNWTNVPTDWKSPEIGKATFRYSTKPVTIKGGDQAADFGLKNLSSIAQLRVSTVAGDACIGKTIDKIVLFSKSEKLLKKAYLAADKIAAGATGTDLYADTEGTKTIVANIATPISLIATGTPVSPYITVLPSTVDDLEAYVHRTDGKWAKISMANTVFTQGKAERKDIIVKEADFKTDYIAVDEATLTQALTEARAVATPAARKTITVIGDITLGIGATLPYNYNINAAADPNITIKGDKIIVPEAVTLYLNTNMESDVRVLGKACCGSAATGGRLEVEGGTINNVTLEKAEANVTPATYSAYNPILTYAGPAKTTVAAGKTVDVQDGTVVVNAAVEHKGNLNLKSEDVTLTVNGSGDLNFMGATVVNNGTIEVKKAGKFDMTDANGNATSTDGQRMTNNGTFIHNVDAGVGTAVQSMNQNGEYRCRVDDQIKLDDAFLQWTACSVIEITGGTNYNLGTASGITPAAYKHNDKYIDIEVNAAAAITFTNPANGAGNGDDKVIMVGNLSVNSGSLAINYTTGTGKRTLTVNGNMEVAANTTINNSKQINVTENLTVKGATLTYKGANKNGGLAVTKDIKVISGATFDAGSAAADVDALNITCANFSLAGGSTAVFGNRTDGGAKNMVVSGTISNPAGCTFNIVAANQDSNGSVLAWVSCHQLNVGGNFPNARPRVE